MPAPTEAASKDKDNEEEAKEPGFLAPMLPPPPKASKDAAPPPQKPPRPSASPAEKMREKSLPLPYQEPPWGGHPPSGYSVEVIKGGSVAETLQLDKNFLVVGRFYSCDVKMEHPSLSR